MTSFPSSAAFLMRAEDTLMFSEAAEAAVTLWSDTAANCATLQTDCVAWRDRLREPQAPQQSCTLARGSSDNAATYARYLIETHVPACVTSSVVAVDRLRLRRRQVDMSGHGHANFLAIGA